MHQASKLYQVFFYVPATHLESVKTAMFAVGGGVIGDYQKCAWQVLGQGQFEPMAGANPFIGEQGALETLAEYRVEMVVAQQNLRAVVEAMQAQHPYEEPAYGVFEMLTGFETLK